MHRMKRCIKAYFGRDMHLYLLSSTTVSMLACVFSLVAASRFYHVPDLLLFSNLLESPW